MSKKKKKTKKVFQLTWTYELLEEYEDFYTKRMFGGLAIYVHGKMMMVLTESPGDREYRGQTYDFDIWHGLLLPTDYEYHDSLLQDFPFLTQHPVLKKWLFLKADIPSFEEKTYRCVDRIEKNDQRFGIFPKID